MYKLKIDTMDRERRTLVDDIPWTSGLYLQSISGSLFLPLLLEVP